MFYQCDECKFATNSPRNADLHELDTNHTVTSILDFEETDDTA